MTIWANWYEVNSGIDFVVHPASSERFPMVNMNEILANIAVDILKIHAANVAVVSMSLKTRRSCLRITLVCVNRNLFLCSFGKLLLVE